MGYDDDDTNSTNDNDNIGRDIIMATIGSNHQQ